MLAGDSLKIRKKYIIPSANRDERIGDLRLIRLIFKAFVSAIEAAQRKGPQRRNKVRANRSAGRNFGNDASIVQALQEKYDIPLLLRGGTLNLTPHRTR